MKPPQIYLRNALKQEYLAVGQLLVQVYSQLEGFPKPDEQPEYYKLLLHVGDLTQNPDTALIVAVNENNDILGAVVYFGQMAYYGSGGTATQEKQSAGFRLLAVHPEARGLGIGKALTLECLKRARASHLKQLIIHTTMAMKPAWNMYENLGFKRSENLDFMQGELPVFGFRFVFEST
ncbi:GNAT family N-acetyltransferase [Formosa sp. S-31]|uniref:GNAT family N-acetyltransferase n=1 Tax=Formosa sp. S-31 TaxID=2790949 RepID=UPI003EB78407